MPVSFVLLLVKNLDLGVARIQTTRLVRLRFGFTKANIYIYFFFKAKQWCGGYQAIRVFPDLFHFIGSSDVPEKCVSSDWFFFIFFIFFFYYRFLPCK